jgi:zinc and cadmium transporter
MTLALILAATLLCSIASLAGSLFLLLKREITQSFADTLLNVAAGVLLGVAFLDLLPEATEEAGDDFEAIYIFVPALGSFLLAFFAERFINVFHHHHEHDGRPTTLLILVGDGLHNFVDGMAVTAAFLTSTPLGISTSLAVAAHEIPRRSPIWASCSPTACRKHGRFC